MEAGIGMSRIELIRAELSDAGRIHAMKYAAFWPLYERYHDDATSPVMEAPEKVVRQLESGNSQYWLIQLGDEVVGAVRIVFDGMENGRSMYRISPLFVLPEFQNRGIGQAVMQAIFDQYSQANVWRLSTIKQEKRNCHLYEKCGFRISRPDEVVNERMTIVFYEKVRED